MLKELSLRKIFLHLAWSVSGGALALILCNNYNLIQFSGQSPHTYIFWYATVYALASLSFLVISILKPKIIQIKPLRSRYTEIGRLIATISLLAIQGVSFYRFILTDETPYRLSIAVAFTLLAAYATWVGLGLLFKAVANFVRFVQFSKEEYWIIYLFVGISTLSTIVINFFTNIFYQADKVFSLDTGDQLYQGVINNTHTIYTGVRHIGESVMTAPLGAITTPLHSFFWFIPNGQYILTLAFFSLLIAVSSILIIRMLSIGNRSHRIGFHILYLLSLPVLLFSSMFEQYVPGVFLIILSVFFLWTAQKPRESVNYKTIPKKQHTTIAAASLVLSGMGVLTSLAGGILFLRKSLKLTMQNIGLIALIFTFFILMSGQLLTVAFGYQEYTHLQSFMSLGLQERINIYSHFVINTIVNTSMSFGEVSYGSGIGIIDSQHIITSFNPYGALLFCLMAVGIGIGIYKKQLIAYASALWIGLSVVVLVVFGWGASNNESTLYTYYFSFAFVVGLYSCMLAILELIQKHFRFDTKILSAIVLCIVILVASINILQYVRIVRFGTTHYPVDTRDFVKNVVTPH